MNAVIVLAGVGAIVFWVGLGAVAVNLIRNQPVRRWIGITLVGFLAAAIGGLATCSALVNSLAQ